MERRRIRLSAAGICYAIRMRAAGEYNALMLRIVREGSN